MKIERRLRNASRRSHFMFALSLTIALVSGQAYAWKIVYDPTLHQSTVADMYKQYMQTIKQYTQDAEAYLRQYEHMKQQLTQLNQVFKLSELQITKGMEERDLSYGTKVCGSTGFSVSDLFSLLAPDLDGDIVSQQKEKCLQIVRLQNMKYNEYVRLLKNLESRGKEISKLEKQVAESDSNGKLDTNIAQAQSIISKTLADSQYSMSLTNVYDGMIVTLKEDQKNLGMRALKGSQEPLAGLEGVAGTLVQGATLKGALQSLRAKDR